MHTIAEKCPAAVATAGPGEKLKLPSKPTFLPAKMQARANTWQQAKQLGDAAELAIANYFAERGYTVSKTIGRADHDLEISKLLEIKADHLAEQTGNVAVETQHNGRPSGLYATSAQLWIIAVGSEGIAVGVDTLRRAVESGKYRTTPAGDGLRARCVLIPLAELRRLPGVNVIHLKTVVSCAV